VELFDPSVSAKLLKSLTVLHFQKVGKEKGEDLESYAHRGARHIYVPGAPSAAGLEQKSWLVHVCRSPHRRG